MKKNGFTLMEVTMVLLLLGILASLAAPRFFDLQNDAERKAAAASAAEAQARMNAVFGESLLSGSSCASARRKAVENSSFTEGGRLGAYTVSGGGWSEGDRGDIVLTKNGTDVLSASLLLPVCGSPAADPALYANTLFNAANANYIKQASLAAAAENGGKLSWQLNSTYDGKNQLIANMASAYAALSSDSFANMGAATWAYNANDQNDPSKGGYFFWSSESISKNDIGKHISVVVYDTETKAYAVTTASISGDHQNSSRAILNLSGGRTGDGSHVAGVSATLNAAQAYEEYSALADKKAFS